MWSAGNFSLFILCVGVDLPCSIFGDDVWCCNQPNCKFWDTNSNGIDYDITVSGASGSACPWIWCVWGRRYCLWTQRQLSFFGRSERGWFQPSSVRVWRRWGVYLEVMNRDTSSGLDAEDMRYLMICARVRSGLLLAGMVNSSEENM